MAVGLYEYGPADIPPIAVGISVESYKYGQVDIVPAIVASESHDRGVDLKQVYAPAPPSPSETDVLMSTLEIYGCKPASTRIQRFLTLREEDPDEPPIIRESLLSLVLFLIQEPQLSTPIISSDPFGLMELEWHLSDSGDPDSVWGRGNGVVSLKFLKSGNIQYVALAGPKRRGQDRLQRLGEANRCEVLTDLGEFTQRITAS